MKRFVLLLLILPLVFSGCSREEFSVSSARIRVIRTDEIRKAVFSFFPSVTDCDYAVTISSPDGELIWKANMEKKDTGEFTAELEITPGLDFPKGNYRYIIYSSKGTENEGDVYFPGALSVEYELSWPYVEFDVEGKVYAVIDGVETEAVSPLDLTNVSEIRLRDSNFNTYTFTVKH